MERDTLQLILSASAALCAAAAWHAARINATKLNELQQQTEGRWHESLSEHGRAERSIGQGEGIQHERDDNAARLENIAHTGVALTEVPTQVRVPNGPE